MTHFEQICIRIIIIIIIIIPRSKISSFITLWIALHSAISNYKGEKMRTQAGEARADRRHDIIPLLGVGGGGGGDK